MDCLEKAMPGLGPAEMLAKAHGQLIQEVVKKEVGWSHASMEYDFSAENVAAFRDAHRAYQKRYKGLFRKSPEARRERAGFLHFCGTHGLTLEGRLFLWAFKIKQWLRPQQ